jgi:hypothetical protein
MNLLLSLIIQHPSFDTALESIFTDATLAKRQQSDAPGGLKGYMLMNGGSLTNRINYFFSCGIA